MAKLRKPRRVIAANGSVHRVYRGGKSVNEVRTLPQLVKHRADVDAAIAAMAPTDLLDIVYYPRRNGTWREAVTIRP